MRDDTNAWPAIPLDEWEPTRETLHLWSQVVGKLRVVRSPLVNHWWDVTFHLTSRGWTTTPIPAGARTFDVDFDFVDHRLLVAASDGQRRETALRPRSVADFYRELMGVLEALDLSTPTCTMPSEMEEATPFEEDERHASYDRDAANRFWRATLQADRVLKRFRERFLGKCSPVHFFWGGFDLAVTRFSGRTAPPPVREVPHYPRWANVEAYSHECSSAGFWPGQGLGHPSFYSYAYPEPEGFAGARVRPAEAAYNEDFGQFLLPYDAVRTSSQPDSMLLDFLQSTYEAAADAGRWDRSALERRPEDLAQLERHRGASATEAEGAS